MDGEISGAFSQDTSLGSYLSCQGLLLVKVLSRLYSVDPNSTCGSCHNAEACCSNQGVSEKPMRPLESHHVYRHKVEAQTISDMPSRDEDRHERSAAKQSSTHTAEQCSGPLTFDGTGGRWLHKCRCLSCDVERFGSNPELTKWSGAARGDDCKQKKRSQSAGTSPLLYYAKGIDRRLAEHRRMSKLRPSAVLSLVTNLRA